MGVKLADRRAALITGACGGMGLAAARSFGKTRRLVLTDIDEGRVSALAATLGDEGYDVAAAIAGDIANANDAAKIAGAVEASGGLGALVHTAGLSPALAGWDAIARVNVLGTVELLDAIEPRLAPGACAVLIASMAGHGAPAEPAIDAILDAPRAADFLDRLKPHLERLANPQDPFGLASPAYSLSKRAVIRMAEARCVPWAQSGARIVSISPGLIWTPMGRKEAEANEGAQRLVSATPARRWGSPNDIAAAAAFLASDEASFISGCDLRVDGGVTPALMGVTF